MTRLREPARISDFMSGMVSDVSETIMPANAVSLALNLDLDVILGAAVVRPGLSQVGSQLVSGKDILGLHQHVDPTNSSNNLLFAALNVAGNGSVTIKTVSDGSNVVTGLAANTKVRFLTYNGETLAINGTNPPRAWNDSTWITTGGVFDLADWPSNESSLVIEFLDRVYANDETVPYRVHYSGLLTSSVIAWGSDFIDIEPEDSGGKLTAFAKVPGYILFFKERSLHRWNFSSAFPESLVQIGTPNQESVVQSGGLVFFYSNSDDDGTGFYVTNGGRPQNISKDTPRNIRRFVEAISAANETKISGFATERVVGWSVGDLTVDGETFNNVVFRYNRKLNQWSIRSYPNEFKVFAKNLVSGVTTRVGGDDNGNVWRVDDPSKFRDLTTNIHWKLRTQPDSYGTNRLKEVSEEVLVRGENLSGMKVSLILDGDVDKAVDMWKTSFLRKILLYLKIGSKVIGTTISVELSGVGSGDRAVIKEIELPAIDVKENYRL